MKLNRIRYDGICWDYSEYFDYINSVADMMPLSLKNYSTDVASYALHGNKTLHDSRMLSAVLEKKCHENFTSFSVSIELKFIDQMFQGEMVLRYGLVESYLLNEVDLGINLHADVLVHEFSVVSPGVFNHRILFDHSGVVDITFREFDCDWREFGL